MSNWNLGSFADEIFELVPSIPDSISGTMLDIVDRARIKTEQYTKYSIGSTAIAEKYQPAILCLAQKKVVTSMMLEGSDSTEIKLGDFRTKKGTNSNLSAYLNQLNLECKEELSLLGYGTRVYKANG